MYLCKKITMAINEEIYYTCKFQFLLLNYFFGNIVNKKKKKKMSFFIIDKCLKVNSVVVYERFGLVYGN